MNKTIFQPIPKGILLLHTLKYQKSAIPKNSLFFGVAFLYNKAYGPNRIHYSGQDIVLDYKLGSLDKNFPDKN